MPFTPAAIPTPRTLAALLCFTLAAAGGCSSKKAASKENLAKAIGNYYNAHPACIWASPVKFPVQTDAKPEDGGSGDPNTGYDALTGAGLLTRTTSKKTVFLFSSKEVNDYDLSSQGRSLWSPDPNQPGYGNFCFGHRDVTSIDNFTATKDNSGDQIANVDYHYKVSGIADWAQSPQMQIAFPTIQADLHGTQIDKATLINTDDGWQVSHE